MAQGTVTKVLIANRGEIACRAQRACKKLGLGCVAVFTEPDALSLHVLQAPESVCLGPSPKEYLNAAKLIEVAQSTGEPRQKGRQLRCHASRAGLGGLAAGNLRAGVGGSCAPRHGAAAEQLRLSVGLNFFNHHQQFAPIHRCRHLHAALLPLPMRVSVRARL
jgi:hypothetical protein